MPPGGGQQEEFVSCMDARKILRNKFICFIGDSVIRGMYKDMVGILSSNEKLEPIDLKNKGEKSFKGDTLVEGGSLGVMHNGIGYREVRHFQTDWYMVRFYFTTSCWSPYMQSILQDFKDFPPDIVIMNSSLWDVTRYGAKSADMFEVNLQSCFQAMKDTLPPETMFIWTTTLFVNSSMHGGFMVPQIEHKKGTIRLDIVQANWFAAIQCKKFCFDLFDLNFVMRRWQFTEQVKDGVHWTERGHRIITTYLLSYIADSNNIEIGRNFVYSQNLPAV